MRTTGARTEPKTASKWPVFNLIGLLCCVFALKLLVVVQLKDHPLVQPDVGLDTTAYVELARRVLGGDLGLGPGLYYVSPLYIYLLAAALAATNSFTAVRVLQIVLGTASVGFIFLSAREWFGERAASLAAALAAFTGLFTFYESLILQASIDPFMTSAALFALTKGLLSSRARPAVVHARVARDRRSLVRLRAKRYGETSTKLEERSRGEGGWLLLAGLIFGVATLNRPNMAFGAGAVAAVLVALRRFRPAAVITAGLIVGMAPAAIRNGIVAHQWSFVSSHGGLNFYIGNSETATGFYHQIPGITPNIAGQEKDARRVAEAATGRPLTEAETSQYFSDLAWAWIRQHPAAAIKLFLYKLGYVFHTQHIALPYSYPFYAHDARTMLRFYGIGPWLLIPLGLVGLAFAAPSVNRTQYLAWVAFVPGYAVGVAAFFVAERYRLPLLVPLCIGAGAALDVFVRAIASRRFTTLVLPAAAFAIVFALANWRHGLHDGRWEEGLRMAERLAIVGRYDEAEQWVRKLERDAPRPGVAEYTVGLQLLKADQTDRALAQLINAQKLDPRQPNVEYALGQALLRAGQVKDAVPHLQRGFESGAGVPLAGYDLAVALQTLGDFSGAASVIRRITPSDEDAADVWLRLGRLATEVKAPDVAEAFFQRAVQMRPGEASARQQLGLNLLLLSRYDEAARELGEAVRLDPRDPDSLAHLAYCELKIGRISDAHAHTEAALALRSDHDLAKQLATALRRMGSRGSRNRPPTPTS